MKRRDFIKSSLALSLVSLGGVSAFQLYQQSLLEYPEKEDFDYQFLNADDRLLLLVLIPVFLTQIDKDSKQDLQPIMQNIDQAIQQLAVRTQQELRELFDLLTSAFGRLLLAQLWLNWQATKPHKLEQFLTEWRESSLDLLQIAYKGLHKLIIGSAYAEERLWSDIGYPGPPEISLENSLKRSAAASFLQADPS